MNEEPKKIWLADLGYKYEVWFDSVGSDLCTPYIRADLVDGLVEALKYCLQFNGHAFMYDDTKAEAALKKLDES
jgi:hypothetical protein